MKRLSPFCGQPFFDSGLLQNVEVFKNKIKTLNKKQKQLLFM